MTEQKFISLTAQLVAVETLLTVAANVLARSVPAETLRQWRAQLESHAVQYPASLGEQVGSEYSQAWRELVRGLTSSWPREANGG